MEPKQPPRLSQIAQEILSQALFIEENSSDERLVESARAELREAAKTLLDRTAEPEQLLVERVGTGVCEKSSLSTSSGRLSNSFSTTSIMYLWLFK